MKELCITLIIEISLNRKILVQVKYNDRSLSFS